MMISTRVATAATLLTLGAGVVLLLSGCRLGDYTHSCADWLKAQSETRLVYPGGIVVRTEFDEANSVGGGGPAAFVDIFVPHGDMMSIASWYAQQLRSRGWSLIGNSGGRTWVKSSSGRGSADLDIGYGVDAEAPATVTPSATTPGMWIDFSYGIRPLSGALDQETARYVCS